MYPTQLHSYLLWRSSVKPDAQSLASRRYTATISLLPAVMCGIFVFGWRAGVVLAVSVLISFVTDWVCHKFFYKDSLGTRQGAWLLTGLLLGLMLPPNAPLWLPIVGSMLAVFIGKYILSVENVSFLQPALVGLLILNLLGLFLGGDNPVLGLKGWDSQWPVLARDIEPSSDANRVAGVLKDLLGGDVRKAVTRKEWRDANFFGEHVKGADAVYAPRPLDKVKAKPGQDAGRPETNAPVAADTDPGQRYTWLRMLLGYVPGTIGGSSALALFFGIFLLIFSGAHSWVIPGFAMATLFGGLNFLAWAYGSSSNPLVIAENIPVHLLTGSTLLGIFYLAADPSSAPRSVLGKVYAGVAIGLIELMLRIFTPLADGIVFSVFLMQCLSFVIDQWLARPAEEDASTPSSVSLTSSSLRRL